MFHTKHKDLKHIWNNTSENLSHSFTEDNFAENEKKVQFEMDWKSILFFKSGIAFGKIDENHQSNTTETTGWTYVKKDMKTN